MLVLVFATFIGIIFGVGGLIPLGIKVYETIVRKENPVMEWKPIGFIYLASVGLLGGVYLFGLFSRWFRGEL